MFSPDNHEDTVDDPGYTSLPIYGWYADNCGGSTHPVGQKLANPWGLYDMHGNVWEWCQDWYGDYLGGMAVDPQGPASGPTRVIHGGSWNDSARGCRSADRNYYDYPGCCDSVIGFRVVLAQGQP